MTGLDTLLMSDGELWVLLTLLTAVGTSFMLSAPAVGWRRDRLGVRITIIAALAIAGMCGFAWWSAAVQDGGSRALVADAAPSAETHR
jgi:MFS family permease